MRKILTLLACMAIAALQAQQTIWKQSQVSPQELLSKQVSIAKNQVFSLQQNKLERLLKKAPKLKQGALKQATVIFIPTAKGRLQRFSVLRSQVMHPKLSARYPQINSFIGIGIDDPSLTIRFSLSPLGFKGTFFSNGHLSAYLEKISANNKYSVFATEDRQAPSTPFECKVENSVKKQLPQVETSVQSSGVLKTFRLAVTCSGEYAQHFGGSVIEALAGINESVTRVNGIFETDFGVRLELVANNDALIFTDPNFDPFSEDLNTEAQQTIDAIIGESNYDIGHLLLKGTNRGNAGAIGSVCNSGIKGSAFTSGSDPSDIRFDLILAHELGHQFGANHTFAKSQESFNSLYEPGSGSTIMSYAGLYSELNVQEQADPYFLWWSVEQVQTYLTTTNCYTESVANILITEVNAGADFTLPAGTPFVLNGTANTTGNGNLVSYCWEQADEDDGETITPDPNSAAGVNFRSFAPVAEPYRYFPQLQTIKLGRTAWKWEAIPEVNRELNFKLTVRDQSPGTAGSDSDAIKLTVNAEAGPFLVTYPSEPTSWMMGSTKTVTWDVAGTSASGIDASHVDIYLSSSDTDPFETPLALSVENNGSYEIMVPHLEGLSNRIVIKGTNHIFFDISDFDFRIVSSGCTLGIPIGLTADSITHNSAHMNWEYLEGTAAYELQIRAGSEGEWTEIMTEGNFILLNDLNASTLYEARVRSVCSESGTSEYSEIITFQTKETPIEYCSVEPDYEYYDGIIHFKMADIDNTSGTDYGYSDFTHISTEVLKGAEYEVIIDLNDADEDYIYYNRVWIDFNRNGDFSDEDELVLDTFYHENGIYQSSFKVPLLSENGPTGLRVISSWQGPSSACGGLTSGEIEDYTVIISSIPDFEAPSAPPNLTGNAKSTTVAELSWEPSSDDIGVEAYAVYQDGEFLEILNDTSYTIFGLEPEKTYEFAVIAVDGAGNKSEEATIEIATNTGLSLEYCPSKSEYAEYGSIRQIELSDTTYDSDYGTGYSDFTFITTNLVQQWEYPIRISPGVSYHIPYFNYYVWIDYNQDRDFDDPGELVMNTFSDNMQPVDARFSIPTDAMTGETLMRVSMVYAEPGNPCGLFSGGEVEDYTINIIPNRLDDIPPSMPEDLEAVSVGSTQIELKWDASTDNVGVTDYILYLDGQVFATTTDPNYTVEGLTPDTTYFFTVIAVDEAGNQSVQSDILDITTLSGNEITYCDSKGYVSFYKYIGKVELANISNESGPGTGYSDFTYITANLNSGTQYSITVSPGFGYPFLQVAYAVWIDLNANGDFNDPGEKVLNIPPSSSALPVSQSFTVPEDAVTGKTRMRVTMASQFTIEPCDIFDYGEVEDYSINITGGSSGLQFIQNQESYGFSDLEIYPNPVKDDLLYLNWTKTPAFSYASTAKTYKIFNLSGLTISDGILHEEFINVSALPTGIYILEINQENVFRRLKFIRH